MNLYAIPDLHGMLDKAQAAVAKIEAHACGRPFRAFFLGDYVDRGPQSREVVNLLMDLCKTPNWRAIAGNHDLMLVAAAAMDKSQIPVETLKTYENRDFELMRHCFWLLTIPLTLETENHVFVHAGFHPRYPLAKQPKDVMLWIRGWEVAEHDFGKHVVYGHTVHEKPVLLKYSTGLDTGACFGGPLSIGVFDSEKAEGPSEILEIH